MRFNLGNLDPASPLARRITAAIARDDAAKAANSAAEHGEALGGGRIPKNRAIGSAAKSEAATGMWRSEADLHIAIVAAVTPGLRPGVILAHVPNGGKRGKAEAGRLKGMGVTAGMPDLLVIGNGRVFGLEIKTDAGRLSQEQKAMAERFRRAGAEYEVARSIEGARQWFIRWGAIANDNGDPPLSA